MNSSLEHIKSLGCQNARKIQMASILYQQLSDVKLKYNINCKYNAHLDLLYITARDSSNSRDDIYIPQSTSDLISLQDVYNFQFILESSRIILAIMEADSTIVYYEFAEGLQDFQINSDVKQSSLQKARAKQYSNIRKIYSEQTECKENVQ
ncbi:uncharacterized protein LOC113382214 [Ctenocephalides felis]|uniref:uncharacterized protein LOC113382214 n=1 Tax=Ctenocephalides felis TaxID=7515 RepID=UPI000E6E4433|nr:uncharacterized protein LOC113382214 [Ctenocephalides felis]